VRGKRAKALRRRAAELSVGRPSVLEAHRHPPRELVVSKMGLSGFEDHVVLVEPSPTLRWSGYRRTYQDSKKERP
jgi:hypothetical protein